MSACTKENRAVRRSHARRFALLNLILLVALLAGCQGELMPVPAEKSPLINPPQAAAKVLENFPQITTSNPDIPEDYEPVAENEMLRLYIRKVSSAILVEDKRTGAIWRSSPSDLLTGKGTTNIWKRQIEIPFSVAYVDAERAQPKNVKVEKIEYNYRPVENGVQAEYTFTDLDLGMAVQYTLKDDCLEASIPQDQLVEKGLNSLVSMDVLPFFGAVRDGEEGYIVFPDGSGALLRYTSPHPDEVQRINTVVYGMDASGGLMNTSKFREDVVMPVFGLSRKDGAFVSMVTEGDFDTNIAVARAGKGIPYNHAWTTFLFRRQGRFSLTGGQPAWLYQPDLLKSNRRIRFCMLKPEDANYVGMASRYRKFLIEERNAMRVTDRAKDKQLPQMHLAFFMGIERKNWFLSDMVTMTTFADARRILQDLADSGVKQVDVSLYNWSRGGTSQRYPQRLPADERLGGAEELRALADDLNQRGQRLFLQDNYLFSAPKAQGVMPFLDAVRGVDGLPIGSDENGYMVNPQISLRSFVARDFPTMISYGADGLQLEIFGYLALPDKNQRYPLSREGFAATWMQIATLSREKFGAVGMEGSNIYVLPYTDRLDWVTIDSTHYDFFDETVPFYHIIAHGLVQYTYQPYNLISDGPRMFLREIEYGNIPMFMLTQNNSAELMRAETNWLYSAQYSFWKEEVVKQYQKMDDLAPLFGLFITGHEQLAPHVYQTIYEDGSKVLVNYGQTEYQAGTVSVPAMDFTVIRGE